MKFQPPPDEEKVYAELASFFALCWQAIEHGVGVAVAHFSSKKREVDDGGLAAHLTRYHAKDFLDAHNADVEFEREELSFSGLLVMLVRNDRRYVLRIRRSSDGSLPFPETETLRAFYKQPKQKYLPGFEPADAEAAGLPETHLMVLWSTPRDYSRVLDLTVACPRAVGEDEVKCHWQFAIPHPSTVTTVMASSPTPKFAMPPHTRAPAWSANRALMPGWYAVATPASAARASMTIMLKIETGGMGRA